MRGRREGREEGPTDQFIPFFMSIVPGKHARLRLPKVFCICAPATNRPTSAPTFFLEVSICFGQLSSTPCAVDSCFCVFLSKPTLWCLTQNPTSPGKASKPELLFHVCWSPHRLVCPSTRASCHCPGCSTRQHGRPPQPPGLLHPSAREMVSSWAFALASCGSHRPSPSNLKGNHTRRARR